MVMVETKKESADQQSETPFPKASNGKFEKLEHNDQYSICLKHYD